MRAPLKDSGFHHCWAMDYQRRAEIYLEQAEEARLTGHGNIADYLVMQSQRMEAFAQEQFEQEDFWRRQEAENYKSLNEWFLNWANAEATKTDQIIDQDNSEFILSEFENFKKG